MCHKCIGLWMVLKLWTHSSIIQCEAISMVFCVPMSGTWWDMDQKRFQRVVSSNLLLSSIKSVWAWDPHYKWIRFEAEVLSNGMLFQNTLNGHSIFICDVPKSLKKYCMVSWFETLLSFHVNKCYCMNCSSAILACI